MRDREERERCRIERERERERREMQKTEEGIQIRSIYITGGSQVSTIMTS
jgi:hypothetical protein